VKARLLGLRAERAAASHLLRCGFTILAFNLRVGRCEIDLLARERSVVVMVEVRARGPGALVRALDTIDARKRARLRAAGQRLWRERFAKDRSVDRVRFDCIAVTFDAAGAARVEHVRAAF
jgi:putative endonuclease